MREGRTRRRIDLVGWAIPVAAAALSVAAIVGAPRLGARTTYAQLSPALAMLDVAANLGLLIVGTFAWAWGRRDVGLLALLAGVCWFGPNWAGGVGSPVSIRVAGLIAGSLTLPLLVHLIVRAARADRGSAIRLALAIAYIATAGLAIAHAVVYVPKLDTRCLALCDLGPVTGLGNHSVAYGLARVQDVLAAVVAGGLALWADLELGRSSSSARRARMAIMVPALLVGLAWASWAIASLPPASVVAPTGPAKSLLFAFQAVSVVALAIGLGWTVSVEHRMLIAVQGIARQLSGLPGGGSLQAALAAALRDPGLRLVFPLPDGSSLVSVDGHSVARPATSTVAIGHGGHVAALIIPSQNQAEDGPIRNVGAAVRLAAENERLFAVVRHELLELRASRSRIVQTGDAARERLERDLHDGAQQRMLSIVYELALARDQFRASGDQASADQFGEALGVADATTEALRRIARGIHDPVLSEAGLVDALDALAVRAPIPVRVVVDGDVSCRPELQIAAWRVVAHAIRLAAGSAATSMSARVSRGSGELRVALEVQGAERPVDLVSIHDRAGAAGGELHVGTTSRGAFRYQVTLPCA